MKVEIEQQKAQYESQLAENDVRSTPAWKRTELLYDAASNGDESAFKALNSQTIERSYEDIPHSALATYFMGKLAHQNEAAFEVCLSRLKYSHCVWFEPGAQHYLLIEFLCPVRHEAALALSKIATSVVWEAMIEVYFLCPDRDLQRTLRTTIARITDQLSGVDPIEKPVEWDVSRRPWFRVLTEPDPQSAAMYAEYYGTEKA